MSKMNQEKWKTLKHNGPIFPELYEPQGYFIYVNSKPYELEPLAEEMAYAWAQKHATDYVKDKTFQKNFWSDFKKHIPKDLQGTNFPDDWDFHEIIHDIEKKKELKKQKTKEDRKREKEEREARKAIYGWAELDGDKTPLGNYMVEPPGLFMGRGKHPLRGHWKPRIFPEDVVINHSLDLDPPAAPEGHEWLRIEENKNSLFTAGWYCKLTEKFKPILFSATSTVKHKSDEKKFGKAIELANNFEKVNAFIEKKLRSRDRLTRQIATVCELISKMSIRVGDEKSEDEADTVGATTLRVEHITIDGTAVVFDFLGKDSVRYFNKVENLHIDAVRNIEEFISGKDKKDEIFEAISSRDVNEFLGLAIEGITAKNFRTAHGSTLLAEKLREQNIDKDLAPGKKLEYFTEANIDVAIRLNHQTAVSEAYEKSLANMKERLKEYKKQLKDKKAEAKDGIESAKVARDNRLALAKKRYSGDQRRATERRARETYEKKRETLAKRVSRLEERIENLKSKIAIKEKTKGVALGTSKLNYSDPRIPISWAKDNDVDLKRIYTPTVQARFDWALDVDADFYKKYPQV